MSKWFDTPDLPERAFQPRPGGRMTLEGGKSSDAPPPDPRLIEAQIRSMGIQDDAIKSIMSNAATMLPLQQAQMQFGLDASRQAYSDSQADRQWMIGRRGLLTGLQDKMVEQANTFDEAQRADEIKAESYADVNSAFSSAREQGLRTMGRMGVNASDGRMAAMNNEASMAQAAALASAGHKANQAARAEGFAITDRATNALAGYPAMGMQATGQSAGFGAMGLNIANSGLAGMNSGFGAAGGMAGQMGQNATSMWNAQGNYQNAQDQNAISSSPWGALLGAGAKLGSAAIGGGWFKP